MAGPLRSWVEKLTRSLTLKRRLPPPFASTRIYVSPSSALSYMFKRMDMIDPTLLRCAEHLVQPGDVVWDIGANLGLFATAAAARAGTKGQVIAFEPDIMLARLLQRSNAIRPPSSANIAIVSAAIAGDIALRNLLIATRGRASNALEGHGLSQMGSVADRQTTVTLDMAWLLDRLPAPQVLKIDIEGAEVEALQGQHRMLEDVRPIIICEVGLRNRRAITALFAATRYRLYDAEKQLGPEAILLNAIRNIVAIPVEKPLPPSR
jgi:FkbM family methyltransferase